MKRHMVNGGVIRKVPMNRVLPLLIGFLAPAFALSVCPPARAQAPQRIYPVEWGAEQALNGEPFPSAGTMAPLGESFRNIPARSFLFNLAVEPKEGELSASRSLTWRTPLRIDTFKTLLGYRTDIRGYVQKDGDSRILLTFSVGGATRVIEFPYGSVFDFNTSLSGRRKENEFIYKAESRLQNATVRAGRRPFVTPPRRGEAMAASIPYDAHITIVVERRKATAEAQVQLDSLDVVPLLR